MTKERRMAVIGAGLIVVAAGTLSAVNYVEGKLFWTLIGVGCACFVVGLGLYVSSLRREEGKK